MTDLQKKENTQKQIVATFAFNKTVDALLVTSDGNCFLESSQNSAELHAKNTGQKIETVKRKDFDIEIEVYNAEFEIPAIETAVETEVLVEETVKVFKPKK